MQLKRGFAHLLLVFVILVIPVVTAGTFYYFQKIKAERIANAAPPVDPNCSPTTVLGGALPGQPLANWCYTSSTTGPSTAVKGNNTWVDDFNHGLSFGDCCTSDYTLFDEIGGVKNAKFWRHSNHWMVDQQNDNGETQGSTAMRPNATFKAENGKLVIETDVAAAIEAYGGNLAWPEVVITTADKPGTGPYGAAYRQNGTYLYETFFNHWTLGCRLQTDGGFTCALLDNTEGGDSSARVWELSHFQCSNSAGSHYEGGCNQKYGGLPINIPESDRPYKRDCKALDPDQNCRDRFRWEISKDRLTWYVNGIRYMDHWQFDPGFQVPDALLNGPVYVYFGQHVYRYDLRDAVRFHWDRIAINPKDANGNPAPLSGAPCDPAATLTYPGQCTTGAGGTVTPTATPSTSNPTPSTVVPTPTPVPTPKPSPTPTPTNTNTPVPTPVVNPSGSQTITFDNHAQQNTGLNGQFPAGLIDWGANKWYISSPWKLFTTKSISFNGGTLKGAAFKFLSPRRVTAIEVYNGGRVDSTVRISCGTNKVLSKVVKINEKVTLQTGFTTNCTSVSISASNGWDTNFDNMVVTQ